MVIGVAAWLRATRQEVDLWQGQPVTPREWGRWERQDGFFDWWAEAFPEVAGPTRTDLAMAEGMFWSQLGRGLAAGSEHAINVYGKLKLASERAGTSIGGTLDEHFEEPDDQPNGWLVTDERR